MWCAVLRFGLARISCRILKVTWKIDIGVCSRNHVGVVDWISGFPAPCMHGLEWVNSCPSWCDPVSLCVHMLNFCWGRQEPFVLRSCFGIVMVFSFHVQFFYLSLRRFLSSISFIHPNLKHVVQIICLRECVLTCADLVSLLSWFLFACFRHASLHMQHWLI